MLDTSIRKNNRVRSFSIAISLVVHMLDTSIRKSNRVRSFSIAITISCLSSVESSLGVVISNSVGVSVRGRNIRESRFSIFLNNRGMVSRGSMDNRGIVDNRSMVDNGSSMNNWGSMDSMDNRCSFDNRNSMDNWSSMHHWGTIGCSMDYRRGMDHM